MCNDEKVCDKWSDWYDSQYPQGVYKEINNA
jgi:hypothetical protein